MDFCDRSFSLCFSVLFEIKRLLDRKSEVSEVKIAFIIAHKEIM